MIEFDDLFDQCVCGCFCIDVGYVVVECCCDVVIQCWVGWLIEFDYVWQQCCVCDVVCDVEYVVYCV